jgi:hypothetical protein
MRLLLFAMLLPIFVSCAGKPPNDEIGFTDAPGRANFTYLVQGTDFVVDNQGHNYTLHGQNLSYDQMRDLFFYVSPWTLADIKTFFLNYCHKNPGVCVYDSLLKKINEVEARINLKRPGSFPPPN